MQAFVSVHEEASVFRWVVYAVCVTGLELRLWLLKSTSARRAFYAPPHLGSMCLLT